VEILVPNVVPSPPDEPEVVNSSEKTSVVSPLIGS
jgi:hypothetical protein